MLANLYYALRNGQNEKSIRVGAAILLSVDLHESYVVRQNEVGHAVSAKTAKFAGIIYPTNGHIEKVYELYRTGVQDIILERNYNPERDDKSAYKIVVSGGKEYEIAIGESCNGVIQISIKDKVTGAVINAESIRHSLRMLEQLSEFRLNSLGGRMEKFLEKNLPEIKDECPRY